MIHDTALVSPRRVIATACMVSAASVTVTATTSYVFDPVANTFGMTADQAELLKFAPSLATILVVFVAGVLGDRIGRRRTISWGSAAFLAGAFITAISPVSFVAVAGLSLLGAGASVMMVVGLALLGSSITGKDERAKAFGTLAFIAPLVYLIAPVLAGAIVTWSNWRLVALIWFVLGTAALVVTRRLLPPDPANPDAGELVTPILAGVAVALGTQVLSRVSDAGTSGPSIVILISATAAVVVALMIAHRRFTTPTLTFGPLRRRSSLLLLLALIVFPLMAMWYTTYLAFEYLFGLTPVQISLIMIPAQLTGMAGAKLMPKAIIGRGLRWAGAMGFVVLGISEVSFVLVGADDMWALVALTAIYSAATSAMTVVTSNAIMDTAPRNEAGTVSSYRAAASRVGGAISALLMGTVVIGTYDASLATQATDAGMSVQQVDEVAASLIDADTSGDTSAQGQSPDSTTTEISQMQEQAMVDSLHAKSMVGAAMAAGSLVLFLIAMRRRDDDSEANEKESATTSG